MIYLKDIASLVAGHPIRDSIKNVSNGDTFVVQMKDVELDKEIDTTHLTRIFLTGRKTPDYLKKGDILFVSRGYRIFASFVTEDLNNTIASPHFFIITVKPNKAVNADYLAWYINHYQLAQRYLSQCVAGSTLPHVNRTTLENLPIVLPPLAVQQQIINTHYCRLKEKALLEKLIVKKSLFINKLLDKTLDIYQEGTK